MLLMLSYDILWFLSPIGLVLDIIGATIILGIDWLSLERRLIHVGERDSILYRIPLLGYPFLQAKNLYRLQEAVDSLFIDRKNEIRHDEEGFEIMSRIVSRVSRNKRLNRGRRRDKDIQDMDFDCITLEDFPPTPKPGMAGGSRGYASLYKNSNGKGWVRRSVLNDATITYADALISKAGASLLVSGFALQLLSKIASITERFWQFSIPEVVTGIVVLCAVLAIPGICRQMNMCEK